MKVYFKTKKLTKICSEEREGIKRLGAHCAKKLRQRLMELKAADFLADISHLPPPRLHELAGDKKGLYSVDLLHPYRLIFEVVDEPLPILETGGLDKSKVCEVLIFEIADTH